MITPVQKNRVYENVSAQICSQIEQGAWKEGDRIQSEMELAKLFQVSRGSIREAIKSLQMAGIVEAHSGQGTFVAPNALQKIRDGHLADMLSNTEYLDDVLQCRYIIESYTTRVASQVSTPEDIAYHGLSAGKEGAHHLRADPGGAVHSQDPHHLGCSSGGSGSHAPAGLRHR